jgi:diguanylate cyclase (GGDEF)-like protein
LYNRRAFDEYMERIWRQSRRENVPVTIMLIDIDHFKPYNDLYGHQAGDDGLKEVAGIIANSVQRPLDLAARYGGEEFALVLYGPADEFAARLPEKLREDILGMGTVHEAATHTKFLSVSIGVAVVYPDSGRSLAGAIQMADEALYQAKEEGRNRVVVNLSGSTELETGRFRAKKAS